jgi:hypothetical protein
MGGIRKMKKKSADSTEFKKLAREYQRCQDFWADDDSIVERCNICLGVIDWQAIVSVTSLASCL